MFRGSVGKHVLFAGVFCTTTTASATWVTNRHRNAVRSDGSRVILPLIAANACVFGLFYMPPAHRVLAKYFVGDIRSSPVAQLLSTFAHMDAWHLVFNMVGLYTFGYALHRSVGDAQFLSMYLNSGVIASLCSHVVRVRRGSLVPSIGASGAVYGIAAASTFLNPYSRLTLIFLPFFSFPAYTLLPLVAAVDLAGVLLKWRRFDHVAHLGGLAAGSVQVAALCEYHRVYPPWYVQMKKRLGVK